MNWKTYSDRYESELFGSIIPFWEKNSIDKKYGGFFTCLDRDGSVYDTDKYMWMQWRIVYMFATLYNSKYKKESWLDIAINGYNFLTKNGTDSSGNYYFALNRRGEPIIAPYNIFSEAFAMMGSAALFKATSEEKYKTSAIRAMNNYIKRIDAPKGKWDKSMPAKKHRLNLGIYMIYANLGIIARDCLNINDYEGVLNTSIELILKNFWNKKFSVLFENINPDFSFDLESCEGRNINPGHGLEACGFFLKYAEDNKRKDIIQELEYYIKSQLKFGWDEKYGGIYYFMDVQGKPHFELQWDMKLWWVHCEALIATLHAYVLTKSEEFLDWFKKIDEWTWNHFPDKEYGEWFAYLNRRGEPTHFLKGGRWKTFFHLPRCLLTCLELMKRNE